MSNLRATAYLFLILSLLFLIISFTAIAEEDTLRDTVFLVGGLLMGALSILLFRRNNRRKRKVNTLF